MATLKTVPVYPGELFTWSANVGCCEASDLSRAGGPMFTRVYEDACDVGCWIVSPRTGVRKLFTLSREVLSPDGDETLYWVLTSGLGAFTVTVFND